MSVNIGGLGSVIRFSDLQTFYGGEHPISLSEYYRGGAEVPSTVLSGNNPYTGTTNFSSSGSGTGGNHGIAVTVDTTSGGPGALTVTNRSAGAGAIGFRTVQVDRTEIGIIDITAQTSFARVHYVNGNAMSGAVRGPAWVNGDSGLGLTAAQVAALPQQDAGSTVTGSGSNGSSLVFSATGRATRGAATPDTHDITFTNNTGQRITFVDADTTGNPGTLNPGESAQVQNDGSSPGWEFEYNYVDAGSGSGTGDETNAGIVTDVTAVPGTTSTSVGPLTRQEFSGNGIVNTADLSYVTARSQGRGNHTVVLYPQPNGGGHPTQIFSFSQDDNPGFNVSFRGAAWQSGDPGGSSTQYGGNRSLGFSGFVSAGANTIGRRTVTTTTSPTTYNVSYRNNNSDAVVLSGSTTPVGAGQTLAANGGMLSTTGLSSPNWSFQYRYAPGSTEANTAIPTSGEIELDQFNAPGNAAP